MFVPNRDLPENSTADKGICGKRLEQCVRQSAGDTWEIRECVEIGRNSVSDRVKEMRERQENVWKAVGTVRLRERRRCAEEKE